MAHKEKNDIRCSSILPIESVRVIAESIGVAGLSDEVAAFLADDVSFRLKLLSQESSKFSWHSKRPRTIPADFESALKARNVESLYGFIRSDSASYRQVSGGGREVHIMDDKEVDLQTIINSPMPKIPPDLGLKAHWLAIDGQQPAIPDNPPPINKEALKSDIGDVKNKLKSKTSPLKQKHKVKVPEKVHVKDLAVHELSLEQQLYYKEITEACVGSDEGRRSEALQSLSVDPGLHQMLPRFSLFIYEGVKVNVVQNNLALLIYLMRMVKSLMDNPSLSLEKYLHEIIPATMTCIVSRQLCLRPDVDNHWALRDFAARLLAQVCKAFNTTTNNIQARITKIFTDILEKEKSLAIHYGAITGLAEMGPEIIRTILMPYVKSEGEKLRIALEGHPSNIVERNAADHIKAAFLKSLPPVIKPLPIETLEEFVAEYGNYLGPLLCSNVLKMRQMPPSITTATQSVLRPSICTASAVQRSHVIVQSLPTMPRASFSPRLQTTPSFGEAHRSFVLSSQPSQPSQPSQRSSSSLLLPQSSSSQPSVAVRVVPSAAAASPIGAPPQKYVVLSVGNSQGPATSQQSQFNSSDANADFDS